MSDWKGIVKKGWHPEKDGTTLKGQVKGLIGRGDKSYSSSSSSSHSAPPISSLRDPSTFGPPPKHVAQQDGNTGSPAGTRQHESPSPVALPARQTTPGAQPQQQPAPEPAPEPRPYRVDTTGLSTAHLPPPPSRRDGADGREQPPPPPPYTAAKPPSLPPRLPPRNTNTSPVQVQAPSPPSTTGASRPDYLNQGAINRLGAAGVSVPALGISKANTPPPPPARASPTSRAPPSSSSGGPVSELQSRFSRLGTSSPQAGPSTSSGGSGGTAPSTAPAQGTTWKEKQAALRTASSFHRDPSSVSFADTKAAAGTANNFRQRHGDQVAAGVRTANGLGQRFGVSERLSGGDGGRGETTPTSSSPMGQVAGVLGKKKPPPPPIPTKKAGLSEAGDRGDAPPPVPMASKPKFG
ncbi:hypothetical protein F4779DRAFT_156601 [Xylariaceae sp. FL0662B]|nr:hypothetical protein F4779DRAFT_156601 [Xylariaceae sp. FL0662B]